MVHTFTQSLHNYYLLVACSPRVHLVLRMCVVSVPPRPQVHHLDHLFGGFSQVVVLVLVVVPAESFWSKQRKCLVEWHRRVPEVNGNILRRAC